MLLDGKTGVKLAELGGSEGAHAGGVYAVAWADDSKRAITASGDKTVKVRPCTRVGFCGHV